MAFVAVDSWEGGAPLGLRLTAPVVLPWWLTRAVARLDDSRLARGISFGAAAAIALMVMSALAGVMAMRVAQAEQDRLSLAVLLERPPPVVAPKAGGAAPPVPASATSPVPPSPIEVSPVTPLSAPEWRVARIAAPAPDSRPGPVGGSGALGAGWAGQGSGAGAGGIGAYDPYAGASPQRRRPDGQAVGAGQIDRTVLDAAITAVKRRYPRAHGRVAMRVRLSPSGMVLDVMFDSRITPALADAISGALIGKQLAPIFGSLGGGVREMAVPEFVLG